MTQQWWVIYANQLSVCGGGGTMNVECFGHKGSGKKTEMIPPGERLQNRFRHKGDKQHSREGKQYASRTAS